MADDKNEAQETNDKGEDMKEESTNPETEEVKDVKHSPAKPEAVEGGNEEKQEKMNNNEENKSEEDEDAEDGDDDKEGDEEDKDDDDDDDEDDEEPEELPPGLLERPLEVEGKRQKKKVERLSASVMRSPVERPKVEIEEGSGTKLGDIPYVAHYINVTKALDMKPLHKLLFLRLCSNNDIKKNIRKFNGLTEAKDSKEHEKRMFIANKLSMQELKNICNWFGLKQIGRKPELMERLMTYLEKPEDQGMVPKKRGAKAAKAPAKKGTKRKRKTKESEKKEKPKKKKPKKKIQKKDKEEEEEEEDEEETQEEEEEMDEEEDGEEEEEVEEEESEDEAPKKKKRKVEVKKKVKATPKKASKENGKKEKATPKKNKTTPKKEKASPKKKPSPKKQKAEELSDLSGEDDSDSDEETLATVAKPPSDEEIKKTVKGILDGADLETVTMKTVVKQVYAKYPKFDLSEKKDFIKSAVREVIS